MKCEEFEAHLNEILDERRRPEWDEQLRLHGQQCRECRDLAAAYGVLFEGFFALPMPEAPADLSARVLEQLPVRPLISRRLAVLGAVFSTAAAVLIAVNLSGRSHKKPPVVETPAAQIAAVQPIVNGQFQVEKVDDIPILGPLILVVDSLDDGNDPYETWAKETGQNLATMVMRMPGAAGPQGERPPAPGLADGEGFFWPMPLSEEFRPVRESVAETFTLLLKALPITLVSSGETPAS